MEPCYYPDRDASGDHVALVLAGGPDDPSEPMQKSIMALLNHARHRAWLTTGYFVPNGSMLAIITKLFTRSRIWSARSRITSSVSRCSVVRSPR